MAKHFPRIDGLTAVEANKVILFRRGPRNYTQMLIWDFNTDEVTPGQWINSRVFTRRSDVSPDGKYVALFIRGRGDFIPQYPKSIQPEPHEDTYVSISRPPHYTSVGLWISSGSWGGAGIWKDNQTFYAHPDPYFFRSGIQPPQEIKVIRKAYMRDPEFNIHRRKLFARKWKPVSAHQLQPVPKVVEEITFATRIRAFFKLIGPVQSIKEFIGSATTFSKTFEYGQIKYHYHWEHETAQVFDIHGVLKLELRRKEHHPLWIDVDNSGRLVYADKGCLYAWRDFPNGEPQLIADLNPNKFENVPPPDWALKP